MTSIPCNAVLFDNDGVLVDSDAGALDAWAQWARGRGLDPDEVLPIVHGRRAADTVARLVPEPERAEALAEIDRLELANAHTTVALPGARELLSSLPAGKWAVVTSGNKALATARLAAADLPLPDLLVTADDVTEGKPAPDGYLTAAGRLGFAPREVVVFEDSTAGVRAGLAAGARVVGVGEHARTTEAEVVVADLRGISWDGGALALPE
ncbi:HAD-IA family hydrolase [Saccharopolyspora griseoalba]|uniref:HAD-IA family hydrolase n=1 Tax=Saccharopolyspora griseoalba TaxID=1431848 RepID=A0ABW2LSU8_9PSEU